MTDEQRQKIISLRKGGNGYKRISKLLGLSENTVKSFCRRMDCGGVAVKIQADGEVCPVCGTPITQTLGKRYKKFCSDKCRMKWWNSHLDLVLRKANYTFICPHCKKPFTVYGNANRKYCCHECYIEDRFGGGGR